MLNLIKYRCFSSFRDMTIMFWSLIFPFILATLFFVAFGDISNGEIDTIKTGLVIEEKSNEATMFSTVLDEVADSKKDFIKIKKMSASDAKKALKRGEISGVYYAGEDIKLEILKNGIEASVLQAILEQYNINMGMIKNIGIEKPEKMSEVIESISKESEAVFIKETNLGSKKPDGYAQYYLALIAMACLFSCYLGMDIAENMQANVDVLGARRGVSATSKVKIVIVDMFTVSVIASIINFLLVIYVKYVLKQELGDDFVKIILVIIFSSLFGISFGVLIGSISKMKQATKIGILSLFGCGSSFLSGLMVGGIKGLIEQNCPLINRINPASVITDAFFSISMFENEARFQRDIITLFVFAVAFLTVAFLSMRRVKYDSI